MGSELVTPTGAFLLIVVVVVALIYLGRKITEDDGVTEETTVTITIMGYPFRFSPTYTTFDDAFEAIGRVFRESSFTFEELVAAMTPDSGPGREDWGATFDMGHDES